MQRRTTNEISFGPYVLIEQLGAGGMAEVWLARKARPLGFDKRFAIKRILPSLASNHEFVAMFIDEARLAAHLSHPNIVQVFDFGEVDGQLYIAMEYIAGLNANALLRRVARRSEAVPFQFAAYIVIEALEGLHFAHNANDGRGQPLRIVHRDVSPANLLLGHDGVVKLTDFGIARAALSGNQTEAGQLKGKLGYMSPEQVAGGSIDHRSDLFSAATVLAELVMGKAMFSGGSELDVLLRIRDGDISPLWERAEAVGRDVIDILTPALAVDPNHRYPSAATFATVLRVALRARHQHPHAVDLAEYLRSIGLFSRTVGTKEPTPLPSTPGSEPEVEIFLEPEPEPETGLIKPTPSTQASAEQGDGGTQYTVRMADGREIGPVSYPRLIEFLTTGQIDGDTLVSADGQPFKAARQLVELSRFVTSPALSWDPKELEGAEMKGDVAHVAIPRLLYRLASQKETGVLHLRDDRRRKKIYVVDGQPEFVSSTDRSELLGEHLVRSGHCLRMEVDMALALLPRFGGHLGDALVGLGVLRPMALFRAMSNQVRGRLLEIFRWRRGEFAYARGRRSHEDTFPLSVEPFELISEGVEIGYTAAELESLLRPFMENVLQPNPAPLVAIDRFRLSPRIAHVLASIEGRSTLAGVLARESLAGTADPDEVYRAIYLGLCCDFVRVVSIPTQ